MLPAAQPGGGARGARAEGRARCSSRRACRRTTPCAAPSRTTIDAFVDEELDGPHASAVSADAAARERRRERHWRRTAPRAWRRRRAAWLHRLIAKGGDRRRDGDRPGAVSRGARQEALAVARADQVGASRAELARVARVPGRAVRVAAGVRADGRSRSGGAALTVTAYFAVLVVAVAPILPARRSFQIVPTFHPPDFTKRRPRRRARRAVRAGPGRRRAAGGLLLDHQPADLRAGRAAQWRMPREPRMDSALVLDADGELWVREGRRVRKGDRVAVGEAEDGARGDLRPRARLPGRGRERRRVQVHVERGLAREADRLRADGAASSSTSASAAGIRSG